MPLSFLFWILMIIWGIFGIGFTWRSSDGSIHYVLGGNLLLWILIALLGWKTFGWPIQG